MPEIEKHYTYIVECKDGTLYTGYTNDLNKRIEKHNTAKGAIYTKYRAPVKLVYHEEYDDKIFAMKREYAIKQLSRKEKEELINNQHAPRCKWCNMNNFKYINYHDFEWGVLNKDDRYLYEMLILESFQAGLSWECVLNKREAFRKAYDNFNINKVVKYDENKINELLNNKDLIRNSLKIKASVNNSLVYKKIQKEYGSFYKYLLTFTGNKIIYETDNTTNALSDKISKDLIKRGMKFVGSTIIYSYLQATGFINSHDKNCFRYH